MGSWELAQRWADALDGVVAPTLTRSQIEDMLAALCTGLIDAARGGEDPDVARQAARMLVAVNYRDPAAVSRTVPVLCTDLVEHAAAGFDDPALPEIRSRAVALAGDFAAGFTAALRAAALAEQEQTLAAVLSAAQEAEDRRALSEARFEAVFDGALVGIGTVDMTGSVVNCNLTLAEMLGQTPESMVGRTVADILGPANLNDAFVELQRMVAGESESFRTETEHIRDDGRVTSIDLSMSAVRDGEGAIRFLVGVAVDVTERKQLADRLWHDANHDALTGLPNRSHLFSRLAGAEPPVGVCYLDLDGFKEINDLWGHTIGDRVLRVVGDRLRDTLGPRSALPARIGGDEFLVLVEKCSGEQALTELADELMAALSAPLEVDGHMLAVGVSIGTAFFEQPPAAADELLQAADAAMYRNKHHARAAIRPQVHRSPPALDQTS
ncbi:MULTISPECIES: sensor domain-containing diguanylate cyclase [Nocardia]|uniref:Diguanylate cyclase n=1 Tax=Nocardia coubleae TaxID=356147 RepID=A0A846WAK8_9NOCA|nr:sensor domain-containing diguanylate cyclase [Nocardia coubleae]NKX90479.1 diguanylate cyclase [Nocardia coubleae]